MWTCLLAQEPTPYIRRARADPPGSVCQDAVRQSLKRGVLCCLNGGVADVTVLLGCCCYDTRAVIDWNCCRIWIIGFLTLFQWSQPRPCADEAQQSRKTEIDADGWSEQNEKLHIICNRLDRWTSAKKERKNSTVGDTVPGALYNTRLPLISFFSAVCKFLSTHASYTECMLCRVYITQRRTLTDFPKLINLAPRQCTSLWCPSSLA